MTIHLPRIFIQVFAVMWVFAAFIGAVGIARDPELQSIAGVIAMVIVTIVMAAIPSGLISFVVVKTGTAPKE